MRAAEADSRRRYRQAERAAVQHRRQLMAYEKELAKHNERARAAHEAAEFQNYLDLLVSLHKDCGEAWDWEMHRSAPQPPAPQPSNRNELIATEALRTYVPGFFEKLFGGAKKRTSSLELGIAHARAADQEEYGRMFHQHQSDTELWNWRRALAARILTGDAAAYPEALGHAGAFEEISALQTQATVVAAEPNVVAVMCRLSDADVVPTEELKLTASGKLTTKAMPAGRYWSLYQDYVCSSAIRVANETFAVLPIERTIVNVGMVQTNPSTGHREPFTFLAVHFARETLRKLNLDKVDPTDSMKNFPHRMKFKKTSGFEPVAPITPQEQWISA
jgi:hypothetical protein